MGNDTHTYTYNHTLLHVPLLLQSLGDYRYGGLSEALL